jgi:hypothetical protein
VKIMNLCNFIFRIKISRSTRFCGNPHASARQG